MSRWTMGWVACVVATTAWAGDASLDKPGEGDKAALRLAIPAGAKADATVKMQMNVSTTVGGVENVTRVPDVTAQLAVSADKKVGDDTTLSFAYQAVTVGEGDPMGSMIARPLAAALEGGKGGLTVSPQGAVSGLSFGGAPVGGSGSQGFDLARWFVPFPDAPVGVGAQWSIEDTTEVEGGLAVKTTTTYALLALADGVATVQVDALAEGTPGTMKANGMTVEVTSWTTKGHGVVVMPLDAPFAQSGKWTVSIDMVAKMGALEVPQRTTLELTVSEAKPSP